jgi:PKHD-type hydroxylase
VYHWRKPFKGNEYIQVFLHYVDADGPYKDHVYDSDNHEPFDEPELRFTFQATNPNLMNWYKFPQGFTTKECDTIIQMFKGQELTEAGVGEGAFITGRRSRVFWVPKIKRNAWIYERVLSLIGQCNDEFFKFQLTELVENLQFTKYDESFQGKYDWHVDAGGPDLKSCRKLSFVLQLSCPSEYEGGELQFGSSTDAEIEVANKNKGAVIIFPSYMRHRATEVTKGTRYSLVTWVNGPPFR